MNMLTTGSDLPTTTIKTREDESFSSCSRGITEEMLFSHSTVEIYYGGAPIAVPFRWESQPGTPKVRFRENPLPPLTPPPCFLFNTQRRPVKKHSNPRGSLLYSVLPKFTLGRKSRSPASPASPASSESSSPSSPWSLTDSPTYTSNIRFSHPRLPMEFAEEDELDSPISSLCFGIGRRTSARSGGYSSRINKLSLGASA